MGTKLSMAMMNVVAMIMSGLMSLKERAFRTLTAKRAGMEGFVVILLICIVAIAIAIVFRDAIIAWFSSIMAKFTQETTNLF